MSFLSARYLTSHTTSDIMNNYTGLDIEGDMAKYYAMVPNLIEAISDRFAVQPTLGCGEEILFQEKVVQRGVQKLCTVV